MKFVLEERNTLFDFQNELYRQKDYYDWLNQGKPKNLRTELVVVTEKELEFFKSLTSNYDIKDWCPVGSVEFCVKWFKNVWGKPVLPKNVPPELRSLCSRKIEPLSNAINIWRDLGDKFYAKDSKTIKSSWSGVKEKSDEWWAYDKNRKFHSHFQISEFMEDINSEWRCFVYENKLVDIKNYSGDPFDVPDKSYVEKCINQYAPNAPVAYTLDICTRTDHPNEIVEVHDFFSCGLYGFCDPKYPLMLWRWFKEFTK